MLCSKCNKNTAIIFMDKIENGNSSLEGLCYDCAKKQGINPLEVLSKQNDILSKDKINISDVSKQMENIIKDLSESLNLENMNLEELDNINIDDLNGLDNLKGLNISINPNQKDEENDTMNDENIDPEKAIGAFAIPLGSIFSNMLGNNKKEEQNQEKKKVKVDKKKNPKTSSKKKFLDVYGTNLTSKAKNNELDLVIGRDKEIQRIIQILNRRSKNNPCLIGEPGVGKTAIAQGLAIKIANNNVPAKLLNKEVYLLDMTSIIAGTQFRGQFESRMKGIIDECRDYGKTRPIKW